MPSVDLVDAEPGSGHGGESGGDGLLACRPLLTTTSNLPVVLPSGNATGGFQGTSELVLGGPGHLGGRAAAGRVDRAARGMPGAGRDLALPGGPPGSGSGDVARADPAEAGLLTGEQPDGARSALTTAVLDGCVDRRGHRRCRRGPGCAEEGGRCRSPSTWRPNATVCLASLPGRLRRTVPARPGSRVRGRCSPHRVAPIRGLRRGGQDEAAGSRRRWAAAGWSSRTRLFPTP